MTTKSKTTTPIKSSGQNIQTHTPKKKSTKWMISKGGGGEKMDIQVNIILCSVFSSSLCVVCIHKQKSFKQAPLPIIFHFAFFFRTFIFSRYHTPTTHTHNVSPFSFIYIPFFLFFFFSLRFYIARPTDFSSRVSSQQCHLWRIEREKERVRVYTRNNKCKGKTFKYISCIYKYT